MQRRTGLKLIQYIVNEITITDNMLFDEKVV